jgi:hypothetical protein
MTSDTAHLLPSEALSRKVHLEIADLAQGLVDVADELRAGLRLIAAALDVTMQEPVDTDALAKVRQRAAEPPAGDQVAAIRESMEAARFAGAKTWRYPGTPRHDGSHAEPVTGEFPEVDREALRGAHQRAAFVEGFREAFRGGSAGVGQDLRLLTRSWGFDLGVIRSPTFVHHGEADATVSVDHARRFAECIPGDGASPSPAPRPLLASRCGGRGDAARRAGVGGPVALTSDRFERARHAGGSGDTRCSRSPWGSRARPHPPVGSRPRNPRRG